MYSMPIMLTFRFFSGFGFPLRKNDEDIFVDISNSLMCGIRYLTGEMFMKTQELSSSSDTHVRTFQAYKNNFDCQSK